MTGILCILAAGLSWYGYAHYMIRNLLYGFNMFTAFKWALDAVLIMLFVYIVRPRKKAVEQAGGSGLTNPK